MSYRAAFIVSLLPAMMAWALALAIAGKEATTASRSSLQMFAADEGEVASVPLARAPEGDEPLALIATTTFASPKPAPTEAPRAQTFARTVLPAERERHAAIIRAAAREFGQDPEFLVLVARCESSLDPQAVGGHGELGILQFKPTTFARNGARLGYTLADIWDVRAQARVAAEMFSRQQQWQWSCAKKVAPR